MVAPVITEQKFDKPKQNGSALIDDNQEGQPAGEIIEQKSELATQSDDWFAENAVEQDEAKTRNEYGDVKIFGGVFKTLASFFQKTRDTFGFTQAGLLMPVPEGILSGFRAKTESRMIQAKTHEEAKKEIQLLKVLGAASGVTSGLFALALTSSPLIAIPWAITAGVIRYQAARSLESQVDYITETDEKKAGKIASEEWLKEKANRRLPAALRWIEKYGNKIMIPGSIILGVINMTSGFPVLGALQAVLSPFYYHWRAGKVIDPVNKWHDKLLDDVEEKMGPEEVARITITWPDFMKDKTKTQSATA